MHYIARASGFIVRGGPFVTSSIAKAGAMPTTTPTSRRSSSNMEAVRPTQPNLSLDADSNVSITSAAPASVHSPHLETKRPELSKQTSSTTPTPCSSSSIREDVRPAQTIKVRRTMNTRSVHFGPVHYDIVPLNAKLCSRCWWKNKRVSRYDLKTGFLACGCDRRWNESKEIQGCKKVYLPVGQMDEANIMASKQTVKSALKLRPKYSRMKRKFEIEETTLVAVQPPRKKSRMSKVRIILHCFM